MGLCCSGRDFSINDSKSCEQRLYGQSLPVCAVPYPDEQHRILLLYGIILEKLKRREMMELFAVLTNLAEATQLYLEEFPMTTTSRTLLKTL